MSIQRPKVQLALIVGASGEAGLSAIDALRENSPNVHIIATTRSEQSIPGADETFHGISIDQDLVSRIRTQLGDRVEKIDLLIYTPAMGEPGFPISETNKEQYKQAAEFSFDPMLALEKDLEPALTVGYSALYWLPHTLAFYGALGFVKKAMEEWCLAAPEKRALVRGGTFYSKSVRGISLLLQRLMKSTSNPELLKMKEEFASSGMRMLDFFLDYASRREQESLGSRFSEPYRRTERGDLSRGLAEILKGDGPIVSVVGPWTWTDSTLPDLPEYFQRFGYIA
ncbi:MAG: hypothetical protein CMF59_13730 [Leptospiraceae bacterium]|nr:hypothetical protein [Leptospiraceae bacterium]